MPVHVPLGRLKTERMVLNGADAGSDGHGAHERRHGGHHDGPEAYAARLVDGRVGVAKRWRP
jgi:hypothetical protein